MESTDGIVRLSRVRADGALIEFEQRPTGYRAYHFTARYEDPGAQRLRFPSVTTVIGHISPKHSLLDWYERKGCEGAVRVGRAGLLRGVEAEDAIEVVREAGEGARGIVSVAQERGLELHAILERYATSGAFPDPKDLPLEWRGYLRALVRWLIDAELQPTAVEQLVAHRELKYAGRFDIRGFVRGIDSIVDLKTRERPRVYFDDLMQVAGYDLGDADSGSPPATQRVVVSIGADGSYVERIDDGQTLPAIWRAGLAYHNVMAPARSYYESGERSRAKAAA